MKIAGMPGLEGNADLAVGPLKPADARGPWPARGSTMTKGPPRRVDLDTPPAGSPAQAHN